MISLKMIIYKAKILHWNIILVRAMVRVKFNLITTKAINNRDDDFGIYNIYFYH